MLYDLNEINQDEHKAIHQHVVFTNGLIWYSPAYFWPEPNDPLLLATQNLENGDVHFHIGYAEWTSFFHTHEFHDITDKMKNEIIIDWYSETMEEDNPNVKIIAFAPLINLWRSLGKSLKVGSSYNACTCEDDEGDYTLLPLEQRPKTIFDDIAEVALHGSIAALFARDKKLKKVAKKTAID